MDLPTAIAHCLCGPTQPQQQQPSAGGYSVIDEKPPVQARPSVTGTQARPTPDDVVAEIISILLAAEKTGNSLTKQVDNAVNTTGWSEWLAERVLHALEDTLKRNNHETWGEALSEAYDSAIKVAGDLFADLVNYVKEHPFEVAAAVLLTLCTMGVLARMTPWVLELLGFGMEGLIEGSFAAWFQSTYGGYVPRGSLMSFLQRLGMTWAKK